MSFLSATKTGPIAEGGTTVIEQNIGGVDYRIHAFENVGTDTFTVNESTDVDVLVVGGGGGGSGGGGGAGGLAFASNLNLSGRTYDITVGGGGAAGPRPFNSGRADNGQNSFFDVGGSDEILAKGGGGSGCNSSSPRDGGSGGGTGPNSGVNGGSATQPGTNTNAQDFGNDGGFAEAGSRPNHSGGGGGATQDGGDADAESFAGDGGDGKDMSASFGTQFGENGFFAGGAAGGPLNGSGNPGTFGIGGGGDSIQYSSGTPRQAIPNTGGGGRHGDDNHFLPGDGGSGIVLIRYEI